MKITKKPFYERIIFFATIVQIIDFVISITIEDFSSAFLPHFNIIVPIVNIFCVLSCFFLMIFPKFRFMQSIILFLQGITMIMNNFLFLGIFLYCFGIALLFCYGYFKSNQKIKIFAYPTPLFLSFFFILPVNLPKFFMAWAYLLFLFFSYLYLYNTIKKTIFERFPFLCDKISKKELPEPGKTINLVDYGLSERQVEIIKKYETGISNYKELAVFFITSESTIKQEMSRICKIFGVENARILFILLQHYNIE